MIPRLVLVVPCYNEAGRLNPQPFLHLIASRRDTALLFVDDGSSDATPAVLADIVSGGGGRISVLTLPKNSGKASAVRHGMLNAFEQAPALAGYWDADLSTPLTELPAFLDLLDARPEVDIVMGSRVNLLGRQVHRRPTRHYFGRVFATAASLALRLPVYDTQCGAKVFRVTEAVRQTFREPFNSRWVMDVEILSRYIQLKGHVAAASSICEVPLHAWHEMTGSRLGMVGGARAFFDLCRIWRHSKRSSSKPRLPDNPLSNP